VLKVIDAVYLSGDYWIKSDRTGNEYHVRGYDGLQVVPKGGVGYMYYKPHEFSLRGAPTQEAAIRRLKRKIMSIEYMYLKKGANNGK
jgi:hypothetical protein